MSPRLPSATTQEATDRLRADARARLLCGDGSMTDIIDPKSLKAALSHFYSVAQDMDIPAGRVALNRAKRALDTISEASKGATRISKAVTRTLWALLLVEMKFARKYNAATSVEPIERFIETVTSEARSENSWDIGKVRGFLAGGWPEEQTVRKLKTNEIGPLHWWHAAVHIKDKEPLRRQTIYDAVHSLRSSSPPRTTARPTRSSSAGSRPGRGAAEATNAALRGAYILDDDRGGTYVPAEDNAASAPAADSPSTPWRFGNDAAAQFTVNVSPPVTAVPPPPPPPPGAARRAQPSPWLPPSGFTADLKWNILDYHEHKRLLLTWPKGQHAPDSAVWEHPNIHGLRVLEDGLPVTSKKPCSNCSRRYYACIPRGSKACLPCYWEKGSQGKCEGSVPPDGPVQKPDYKLRVQFLQELDAAGVYPFPHHYIYEDGRARHGAGAGGIGKPPGYPSPAPRYSPARATAASAEPAVSTEQAATTEQASAAPSSSLQPTSAPQDPTASGPTPLVDGRASVLHAAQDGPSRRITSAPQRGVSLASGQEIADAYQDAAEQPDNGRPAGFSNRSDGNAAREDSAMMDLSNAPAGTRKRVRPPAASENELPTTQLDGSVGEAAPPRKRKRREGPSNTPKPSTAPRDSIAVTASQAETDHPPSPRPRPFRPATAVPAPPDSEVGSTRETASDLGQPGSRTQSLAESPAPEDDRSSTRPRATDKGKGKASMSFQRSTGAQQRASAGPASRGVQFHDPVPGTRQVPQDGLPRFGVRPQPVIPDNDMRIDGAGAYGSFSGVSRISFPQGAPPPMSTLNLSGDIFLANHVERALCHEMRDISNHHRDWILGRYDAEHVTPRHREIMQSLRELKDQLTARPANPPANPSAGAGAGIDAPLSSGQGGRGYDQLRPESRERGFSTTSPQLSTGLSETRLTEILAQSLAPFHDMAGNVQDLTRRFAELEPVSGRVTEMSGRIDGMSGRVESLFARVQRLEDVGPLALNLRALAEHQDRVGEAGVPMLVLREPVTASAAAPPPPPPPPPVGQAQLASPSTLPDAVGQHDFAAHAPSASRASSLSRRSSTQPLQLGESAATRRTSPHGDVPPVVDRATASRHTSSQRDGPSAIDGSSTPVRRVSGQVESAANDATGQAQPPLAVDIEMADVHTPGATPQSESPLTADPSPGNFAPAIGAARDAPVSPTPISSVHAQPQALNSGADHSSSDDEVPMETGEDWAAGHSRKRQGSALDGTGDARAAKRRHGEFSSDDEDADGSSDNEQPPPPVRAAASRAPASRAGKGRGSASDPSAGNVVNARRAGLRERPPRST